MTIAEKHTSTEAAVINEPKYSWEVPVDFEQCIDQMVADLPEDIRMRIGKSLAYAFHEGRVDGRETTRQEISNFADDIVGVVKSELRPERSSQKLADHLVVGTAAKLALDKALVIGEGVR